MRLQRRVATMLAAAKAGWHIGNTEARSHRHQTLKVEPGRYRDLGRTQIAQAVWLIILRIGAGVILIV